MTNQDYELELLKLELELLKLQLGIKQEIKMNYLKQNRKVRKINRAIKSESVNPLLRQGKVQKEFPEYVPSKEKVVLKPYKYPWEK